ncbi:hypothetical protein [Candidatus Nitrotoga sp. M5]|nr:hypothetical protein [Candidatus Nitrotoga sp. M5]CAH1388153.1 hypothetical protein NTGM5_800041 [Candidatus Nitrotoga sp. M5]
MHKNAKVVYGFFLQLAGDIGLAEDLSDAGGNVKLNKVAVVVFIFI